MKVIFIVSDALNYINSLHIQDLFDVVYTNYHTSYAWTLPSIRTLFEGRVDHPYSDIPSNIRPRLVPDAPLEKTIAEDMKILGFTTKAKVVGGWCSAFFGYNTGFDEWVGHFEENGEYLSKPNIEDNTFYFAHSIWTHEYIEELTPEERKLDKPLWMDIEANTRYKRAYIQRTKRLPEKIGWIRDEEDSLIIFTADHGEAFLEDGHSVQHGVSSELAAVSHVPFYVKYPDKCKRGGIIDSEMHDYDVKKWLFGEVERCQIY